VQLCRSTLLKQPGSSPHRWDGGKCDGQPFFNQGEVSLLEARIRRIVSPKPRFNTLGRKFLARLIGRA
jgi:hypothetical protein